MNAEHERPKPNTARGGAGICARFWAMLRRLRDTRGATTVEHALVMSIALTGAVGFKELGAKVQKQYEREGVHIEGHGMPRNGKLSLEAAFDPSQFGCPGGLCSKPDLSLPLISSHPGGSLASPIASLPKPPKPGGTTAGTAPAAPGPPTLGPLPLTDAQRDAKAECEAQLTERSETLAFVELTPEEARRLHTRKSSRPDKQTAISLLCLEMACECHPQKTQAECIAQWQCIYEKVAPFHTSTYFENMSVQDGADECPDHPTYDEGNSGTKGECVDKQLKSWACYKGQPVVDEQGKPYPTIFRSRRPNPNRDGDVSQAAGEDAARNFASRNFAIYGYTCQEEGGSGNFDLLCVRGSEVVIIEAKGGGAGLGKRKGTNGEYVEQGTEEYARAIAAVMAKRASQESDPVKRAALAAAAATVAAAVDGGSARYFQVTQPFDAHGNPAKPELQEFDLANPDHVCPACKCGGSSTTASPSHVP
jgi:hypothetical protein